MPICTILPPPPLIAFMTGDTPYTDHQGLDKFVVSWSQHKKIKFYDFHGQAFHTSTKYTVCMQPFGNFVSSRLVSLRGCYIWPWWPTLKPPCPNKCCWTWHTKWHTFFSGNILFSCSSCILLHTLQIHHQSSSFSGSGSSVCGSLTLASKSLAYSKLPRPWLSTRIRSFSISF